MGFKRKLSYTPPEIIIGSKIRYAVYLGNKYTDNFTYLKEYLNIKKHLSFENVDEYLRFRFNLDYSKTSLSKIDLSDLQLIALAENVPEIEMRVKSNLYLKEREHNLYPIKILENIVDVELVNNVKVDKHVSKAYYDYDLLARDAIITLYEKGKDVNDLSRYLSVGAFGKLNNRKVIPTKYSITASDSVISDNLLKEIRTFPILEEILVYKGIHYDNKFIVLFLPSYFSYELIECILREDKVLIKRDFETYSKRTKYVEETAGGYYAIRLGIAEKLYEMEKQASVIVLREILPEYYMSVGVWMLRESIRELLKTKSYRFHNIKDALSYIRREAAMDLYSSFMRSKVLKDFLKQKRLFTYL